MELLTKKDNFKISNDVFKKIIRDLKSEIKENRKGVEKLNKLDYEYNKNIIHIEDLIKTIDFFKDKQVIEKETKNVAVLYYGDPNVTIQICLSALLNCQRVNIIIDDINLGINKLIIELYKEILKEYRIYDIVSFNNYENKEEIEKNKNLIDIMYCLGHKNLYTVCSKIKQLNIEYVPFNNIDIYCEDEELYDLAEDIFNVCFEKGIEAEIYDDIELDEAIKIINEYGEKYCSIILTKNKNKIEKFKTQIKSKFVFANENPFKTNIAQIPEIF